MTLIEDHALSTQLPGGAESLRFDQTVPRGLVHRAAISETFLTDAVEAGPDRYLVAAQLPRAHALYNDVASGRHDLLLLAEAVRQAGTLIAHRFYGVPAGTVFPLRQAQIEITDVDALAPRALATELIADVQIDGQDRQSGALSAMSLRAQVFLDGRVAGWAGGAMHLVSPSGYGALRGQRQHASLAPAAAAPAAAPVEPLHVGRHDPRNVVVGALGGPAADGRYSCPIVVDTGHPAYFDHPQDHVPGMLLLEAYRQAALLAVADACAWAPESLFVLGCDAGFSRYAELGVEARCEATVGAPVLPHRGEPWVPVSLEVLQGTASLSRAELRVADLRL
jgi:hypothetical protein